MNTCQKIKKKSIKKGTAGCAFKNAIWTGSMYWPVSTVKKSDVMDSGVLFINKMLTTDFT